MSLGLRSHESTANATPFPAAGDCQELLDELRSYFAVEFSIWDGSGGDLVHTAQPPRGDEMSLAGLVRAVAGEQKPQFVGDADAVAMLALPCASSDGGLWIATAPFLTRAIDETERLDDAAKLLGTTVEQTAAWARQQTVWSATALQRLAEAVVAKRQAEVKSQRMAGEVKLISHNLASTYEEISLLYMVTQNLRISSTDEELGRTALEWLADCVPAEAVAIQYLPVDDAGDSTYKARKRSLLVTSGDCPIDNAGFSRLLEELNVAPSAGPYVGNRRVTGEQSWSFPSIRQLIVAPLSEGDNLFGWLAAFNHREDDEFGTVEANLLNSLGALLGIHSSNRELYRQQSEFLANVVRALVSAIDAKDPYTSGHSDRVARFAVRIALELRCNPKLLNTIYMAGLLHDVGKIGIDDNVLRKAGRLTEAEFEHIKMHPEMGYKILADLKQLADVLPAVLHHHEQWDGEGYPRKLQGERIPLMARIMAVADAYDAMTSDRPYRAGMPDEKVDDIFQRGSGTYWDPEVVEAYFKAKPDILEIAERERARLEDPLQPAWL